MSRPPTTIALPLWARALLVLGGLGMAGMGVLGVVASVLERDLGLLALVLGVFVPMGLGWVGMVRVGLRRVWISDDAVVVKNLILSDRAELSALQGHTHDGPLRLQHTRDGRRRTLSVRLLIRDLQTRVLDEVEARSPALRQARLDRQAAGVPCVLPARREAMWTNVLGTAVLGGMMGLLAAGGAYEAIRRGLEAQWSEAAIGLGMGTLGALFGLLFLWMFATGFTWRWSFTDTHVGALRTIGWRRYPVSDLVAMELRSETRVMKGVPRQAWLLEFRFTEDRTLRVEPTENGLPARFAPADDHRELSDLERRLRPVYFPVAGRPAADAPPAAVSAPAPTAEPPHHGLAPLAELLSLEPSDRAMEGERIRDQLGALPPSATPALLAATEHYLRDEDEACVVDVLLLALTDRGEPVAWPVFAQALDHSEAYVRFVAACGLDLAAGERFRIVERSLSGGHIDDRAVSDRIPGLKKWWRTEGRAQLDAAQAAYVAPTPTPPRVQRWNFIALNPTWVMEAGGTVHAPSPGTRLPRQASGVHVVGGTVRPTGSLETVEAVCELCAATGRILAVAVREDTGWRELDAPWGIVQPRFQVAT